MVEVRRHHPFRKAQRSEARVPFTEKLNNHRFRNRRDSNILFALKGRKLIELDVDEILEILNPKPAISQYWENCNKLAMKGGIPAKDQYDIVEIKYGKMSKL